MRLEILELSRRIRQSFWFLPTLMVAAATALAFVNLYLDRQASGSGDGPPSWLAVAGAESARSLLSTIAGSMITVTGVTFSIVIVALTLASSQFGPRLLVGFMEDKGNQVTLGTFISVFVYCLVVLVHLPGSAGSRLLPQLSILTGVALAVLAVGVLIFFIHHIATSIQAGHLVVEAGHFLEKKISSALPEDFDSEGESWPPRGFSEANGRISAPRSGYLSRLDVDRLSRIATEHGFRLMVVPRAGDFVFEGQTLALVTPADALNDAKAESVCQAISLVEKRESAEDLPLAFERLTEIAVRGLSPGINDPYTALAALHRLTLALDGALERLPANSRSGASDEEASVYFLPPTGEELLEIAYGPIRTYGAGDARILEALLDGLASLSHRRRPRWDESLSDQMDRVFELSRSSLTLDYEKDRIESVYRRARSSLGS